MEYKKEEKKSSMLLTTHSGMFHMDEVVATAILRLIFPNSKIVRTRDETQIAEAQIVYDVGKVFDPQTNRFDHHQKDFNEYISDKPKIKLSSAGLIYKYFHKQLFSVFGYEETEEHYQDLYKKVYEKYFLGVDGIDNGHKREETYYVRPLQDAVRDFNSEDVNNDEEQMENFLKAVEFITLDLTNYLKKMVDFFKNKLKETTELIKQSDEIIISKKYVSRSTVSEYEKKYGKDIKFIILDSEEGQKRVFTIPISPESFDSKVPLNPEWLIDDEQKLREVSGIATINFVHSKLFTGGCGTFTDAKLMCKKSLEAFRKAVEKEENPSKEEQSFKKKEENK